MSALYFITGLSIFSNIVILDIKGDRIIVKINNSITFSQKFSNFILVWHIIHLFVVKTDHYCWHLFVYIKIKSIVCLYAGDIIGVPDSLADMLLQEFKGDTLSNFTLYFTIHIFRKIIANHPLWIFSLYRENTWWMKTNWSSLAYNSVPHVWISRKFA